MEEKRTTNAARFKLKIQTKLLIVLLGLSLVLLILSAYAMFSSMAFLGDFALKKQMALKDEAVASSISTLQQLEEGHLSKVAGDQAYISNVFFERIEAQAKNLSVMATYFWSKPDVSSRTLPSYTPKDQPPDPENASVYVLAPGVTQESVRQDLELSSNMDILFTTIKNNLPNVVWVYLVTESGIMRSVPWGADETPNYDPRTDPQPETWYQNTVKTGLRWSVAYPDAVTGKPVISCWNRFYGANNVVAGIIGIDVALDALIRDVISTQIGTTGYAFLIDNTGKVIAHPKLTLGVNTQAGNEAAALDRLLESTPAALEKTVADMIAGNKGIARIPSATQQEFYLAYAPVPATKWSLGVIMPVETVIAPAKALEKDIEAKGEATKQKIEGFQRQARSIMTIVFIVMLAIVGGITFMLAKRFTRPVLELHHGVEMVGKGDLDHQIVVDTGDELEDLANAFNKMTGDIKQHIKNLEATTAAKKKIETELNIARTIQASLLPQTLPQVPGWDVDAYFCPARQVAGDFYDIFPIEDGKKFFFVVADVCDKGVGPAMFGAITRTLLRAFSDNYSKSTALEFANLPLSLANDFTIANETESNMFVTIFSGVFDPEAHKISYVNCGHNPPYIVGTNNKIRTALKPTGPILGVFPGIKYKIQEASLEPGETLFVFTDGVPEAHDPKGALWEDGRMRAVLEQPISSAKELLERVDKGVRAHIATADQFDDITMLVIRRKPE